MHQLSEQEQIRRNCLQKLRDMGINPYPEAEFKVNAKSQEILDTFKPESGLFQDVTLAGRLMARRVMGKASFAELQDSYGRIQLYISRDEICPDENKDLYNEVFKNYLTLVILLGFQVMRLLRRWAKSQFT